MTALQAFIPKISDQLGETPLPDPLRRFVAASWVAMREPVRAADLLEQTDIAFNTLTNLCRRYLGSTPMHWVWVLRTVTAAAVIAEVPGANLTSVAFHCGFSSSSHFCRKCHSVFAVSPRKLRTILWESGLDRAQKIDLIGTLVQNRYKVSLPLIFNLLKHDSSMVSIFNPPH